MVCAKAEEARNNGSAALDNSSREQIFGARDIVQFIVIPDSWYALRHTVVQERLCWQALIFRICAVALDGECRVKLLKNQPLAGVRDTESPRMTRHANHQLSPCDLVNVQIYRHACDFGHACFYFLHRGLGQEAGF